MSFEAGVSGNPVGRPKGSYGGRIQALAALDRMLGKKRNQSRLVKALEQEFQSDPVRFFKTVIMPLLPRESRLAFDHEGVIEWRSLLGGDSSGPRDGEAERGLRQLAGGRVMPSANAGFASGTENGTGGTG